VGRRGGRCGCWAGRGRIGGGGGLLCGGFGGGIVCGGRGWVSCGFGVRGIGGSQERRGGVRCGVVRCRGLGVGCEGSFLSGVVG